MCTRVLPVLQQLLCQHINLILVCASLSGASGRVRCPELSNFNRCLDAIYACICIKRIIRYLRPHPVLASAKDSSHGNRLVKMTVSVFALVTFSKPISSGVNGSGLIPPLTFIRPRLIILAAPTPYCKVTGWIILLTSACERMHP